MAIYETPSITGGSRSGFTGRLKTDFMAAWDDHVHTKCVIADVIAKKKGKMGGHETLGSVRDTLPQSAGIALFENDTLPTPSASAYFQPKLHARDMYTRLRWTGSVERAARAGNKVAWAGPRKEDLKGADEQFKINFARMLYLGPYQPMATVSAFNGTTTATLYGPNARRSDTDNLWKFGKHYLRVGQYIDWVQANGGNVLVTGDPVLTSASASNGVYITAISNATPSAPTITLSADPAGLTGTPADPADESIIIPLGSRRASLSGLGGATSDPTFYAGVNGLMQMCTDSNVYAKLYDLSRSTYASLSGQRNTNSGVARAFDEHLIMLAVDNIANNGTGDDCDKLVMNHAVRREYVRQTAGDRRFPAIQKEKGYAADLAFTAGSSMLPMVVDRDCPPGLVFVLNTKHFGYLSQSEMNTDDERFVADKDAKEVIIHKSGNVYCEAPMSQGTIEDIEYDVSALTA